MTYTTPVTGTVGYPTGASVWNAGVRDNMEFLARKPLCKVRATVAQTLTSGAFAALLFDTEDVDDPAGSHSTTSNTDRIVAPVAGWYRVTAHVEFAANATGNRFLRVRRTVAVGGVTTDFRLDAKVTMGGAQGVDLGGTEVVQIATAGDYLTVMARQDSGGNLDTVVAESTPSFSIALDRII